MHSFCSGNQNGKPICKTQAVRVGNIKTDLQETGRQTWIGLIWLRAGTCDWLLQTWQTFGFDKMRRVCQLAKELLVSQEGQLHAVKQSVSQLATYHIFSFFSLYLLKKSCSCAHTSTEHSPYFAP